MAKGCKDAGHTKQVPQLPLYIAEEVEGKKWGKLLKYKNWNKPNKKTEIQLMWNCLLLLIITWGVGLYLVIN